MPVTLPPPNAGLPFGQWLAEIAEVNGDLQGLIMFSRADPLFPRDGEPDAVRSRLQSVWADQDLLPVVDEAERLWRSTCQGDSSGVTPSGKLRK